MVKCCISKCIQHIIHTTNNNKDCIITLLYHASHKYQDMLQIKHMTLHIINTYICNNYIHPQNLLK